MKPGASCSVPPLKVSVSPAVPRLLPLVIASVPWLIVHGVTWPGLLVNVQVPAPVFTNTPKFWNCPAGPRVEVSKVWLPLPPRRSVSAALKATTLPVMVEPVCNSSRLVPPVKTMALARGPPSAAAPPEMLPPLITVSPEPMMPTPPAPAVPAVSPVPPEPPAPPEIVPWLAMARPLPTMPAPPAPPLPPWVSLLSPLPPAPPVPPETMAALELLKLPLAVNVRPTPPLPPLPPWAVSFPKPKPVPPAPPAPPRSEPLLALDPEPVTTAP